MRQDYSGPCPADETDGILLTICPLEQAGFLIVSAYVRDARWLGWRMLRSGITKLTGHQHAQAQCIARKHAEATRKPP